MVKLNNKKIRWIIRHIVVLGEETPKSAATIYEITERRIRQLVKHYRMTGEVPTLKKNRRPKTFLTDEEKRIIDKVWEEVRLGGRLLYYELRARGYAIPHNKINKYLLATDRTVPNPNKQRKRKRCRYEREHSGSLVHGDWHRTTENHPYAIAWEDDASRKILAAGEFVDATSEHTIETFKEAEQNAGDYNVLIREANTDRGAQFFCNKNDGISAFEKYLESQGIRYIPSRRRNPQTNGKEERLWYEYDRHRWRFASMWEFVEWYNRRIHGALDYRSGENPSQAFIRKRQPESILGLFMRWSDTNGRIYEPRKK